MYVYSIKYFTYAQSNFGFALYICTKSFVWWDEAPQHRPAVVETPPPGKFQPCLWFLHTEALKCKRGVSFLWAKTKVRSIEIQEK